MEYNSVVQSTITCQVSISSPLCQLPDAVGDGIDKSFSPVYTRTIIACQRSTVHYVSCQNHTHLFINGRDTEVARASRLFAQRLELKSSARKGGPYKLTESKSIPAT